MTDERRNTQRIRSLLKGQIRFNHGMANLECVVRNISGTGARLAVSESVTLPEEFELHIPQKGQTFQARLRWRRADEIGCEFEFAAASSKDGDPAELVKRIAALEAENAELRRQLAGSAGASKNAA